MEIGFYGLRKFGRFIKRLFRWLPVLWRQEEWDYGYIYDILDVKLKELRDCIAKDDIHADAPTCLRQINICLKYLDRYRNADNYIKFPDEKPRIVNNRLETSEEYTSACLRLYEFEQGSRDKFWKRFVQWHSKWWV